MTHQRQLDLEPAIDAPRHAYPFEAGITLNYYAGGPQNSASNTPEASGRSAEQRRPLILLHSINAAPSAMEVLPLFEHFREHRPVYALELPGFGFSSRGPYDFTPAMFARAIAAFSRDVVNSDGFNKGDSTSTDVLPDIVALSLTSEFVARAVTQHGLLCRSLVLISPTGMGRRPPPSPEAGAKVLAVLKKPWLGKLLWRTLVSRASIRFFLRKAFHGPVPTPLMDYAWLTAQQADAQYAPFSFLSMQLFTASALQGLYQPLRVPTLVVYDRDPNVDFDSLPELLDTNPDVSAERIAPTLGLPHWEKPEATFAAMTAFWDRLSSG